MQPHVVVLIPGITGSVLEKNGKVLWGPSAGFVMRMIAGGGIEDLVLREDDAADERGDGTTATRLFPDVHLFPGLWRIDGYTKVADRLKQDLELEPGVDYFEFPYDWRRDNRIAAQRLQREAAGWLARKRTTATDAKLVLVAHSMGGLIARYFLEVLGGWRDTAALITFGTPYRGSLNALDSLSNGVRKLLRAINLTEAVRSFTSTYQLLPIYPCYDAGTGSLRRLKEVRELPGLKEARVAEADRFHREIEAAVEEHERNGAYKTARYAIHPVIGVDQPTAQSARLEGSRIELVSSKDGRDEGGDGTVPRVSATPIEKGEERAVFISGRHASLQNVDAVLTQVHGILTEPAGLRKLRRVGGITVSLDVDDVFVDGEPIIISAAAGDLGEDLTLLVQDSSTEARVASAPLPRSDSKWRRVELRPLPPGVYRAVVSGNPNRVEPVSDVFAVGE